MVDPERLHTLLAELGARADDLAGLASAHGVDGLAADRGLLAQAKWYLLEATQLCLDIGNHVIAAERLQPATVYADVPRRLADADWLPQEVATALASMPRFRNRLVHRYLDLDDREVARIAAGHADDFHAFRRAVAGRLVEQDDTK